MRLQSLTLLLVSCILACTSAPPPAASAPAPRCAPAIAAGTVLAAKPASAPAVDASAVRAAGISARIRFLADDLLEGRMTGSRGHAIAERYVASELQAMGAEPGGDGGTFLQAVPIRAAERDYEHSSLVVTARGKPDAAFKPETDFLLYPDLRTAHVDVEAPLVFAGFGVTAPEYGYDDLAGLDLKGKIAVVFVGAPQSDRNDFFPPIATNLYRNAGDKAKRLATSGAVGVIQVYRPEDDERTPWPRLVSTQHAEQMAWTKDGEPGTSAPGAILRGTISWKTFDAILARAGIPETTASLSAGAGAEASTHRLRTFDIPAKLHGKLTSKLRDTVSHNVIGILRGSDPKLAGEYVVYSAHLDHLGISTPVDGDSIYNGALDNASGVAAILEIARAYSLAPRRPARSLLFIACTGEERGLIGSEYFARFPTVPAGSMVADFNVDMVVSLGPVHDVGVQGGEHSSLGPLANAAAQSLGLETSPDTDPKQFHFSRSDQWSFVKQGIPAIKVDPGRKDEHGRTEDYAARDKAWMATRWHTPKDEWDPSYDYEGMAQVARVELLAGLAVANAAERPSWNKDDLLGRRFASK